MVVGYHHFRKPPHLLLNGWNAPGCHSLVLSKVAGLDLRQCIAKRGLKGEGGNHRGLTVFLLVFREGAQESVFFFKLFFNLSFC